MADKPVITQVTGQADNNSFQVNTATDELAEAISKNLARDGSDFMAGDLNMNSNQINNLAPPTALTDAARLADIPDGTESGGVTQLRLDLANDADGYGIDLIANGIKEIDTIADLRSDAVNTETVYVKGYYVIGDGGGGQFYWDSSSIETDNNVTIFKVTTITAGRWKRLYSTELTTKMGGAVIDNITDDRVLIQNVMDVAASKKIKMVLSPGTSYISNPGLTLTSNTCMEGTQGSALRCERTYFDDTGTGTGKYTVGQGNVINGDSLSNITLKDVTIIGAYDTSWGEQNIYANNVPAGQGSNLLFLLNCTDITLDNFKIQESFSSFVNLTSTHEAAMSEVYGWNQIKISGCTDVKLKDCSWVLSGGEAWLIYNTDKVDVVNSIYDLDYCTSQLDIIYCTNVLVEGCKFLRRLQSDSGDLLNVSSKDVIIDSNNFYNGNCDVGNEYLARLIPLGQSFPMKNIVVSDNNLFNGYVQIATSDDITTLTWSHENIEISNNNIEIDLDNRPAANGSTTLNYTAVYLPYNHNSRNITIKDNNISIKGALQLAGTPSTNNRYRLINGLMEKSGYNMLNVTIEGNTLVDDITSYSPDNITDFSGFITLQYGNWENLIIKNNTWGCNASGVSIKNHDSLNKVVIKNNSGCSENFLNLPFTTTNFVLDDINISENEFIFNETSGHTYTGSDMETKGAGRFCNIVGAATTTINRLVIDDNTILCPSFAFITNFNTTTSFPVDGTFRRNKFTATDYVLVSGTVYPFRVGRVNSNNDYSAFIFTDNYFIDSSTSSVTVTFLEWFVLDMLRNQFIGDFTIAISTDNLAAVTGSRAMLVDNIATGTISSSLLNVNTAILKRQARNTSSLNYSAVTNNLVTDP